MDLVKIHDHIDSMQDHDLDLLRDLVKIPSIADEKGIGVQACAEYLKKLFESMGFYSKICQTKTHPMVFAELHSKNPDAKTILFYGHYDVQPVEPIDGWNTDPFSAVVKDGRIYGRGTADNKGQFLAHILAIRSYLKLYGDIPVNAKFLLDGEEEIGSPSMPEFVSENMEMLKADMVYFSDGPSDESGATGIMFGFRGEYTFEVNLRTATHSNHSGRAGGQIKNAAIEMCHLLTSMVDEDYHLTIDGIYDDVLPATDYEKELIEKIPYDAKSWAKILGVDSIKVSKEDFYARQMFLPTFTTNGVKSGYIGEGDKAAVPEFANMKVDMRLVDNMDPDKVETLIRNHILERYPDAEIHTFSKQLPSKTSTDLPLSKAIVETVRKHFPGSYALPTSGATCPDYVWTKILKIPAISVPYGNYDQTNHAANENLTIKCFNRGIHCSADVINAISKL